ncbi:hypothetical protein SAMN04488055_4035 [Chitinophaga niabensis]|uniref:Uncharacterized protein n=1 Tax=Chitinophaga niabensis TaxID=536979 RepID=A0A1N6JI75_9BACT|nr:hypothetical protein SAMN04488055_4035 [Chitinophaga niabensis]
MQVVYVGRPYKFRTPPVFSLNPLQSSTRSEMLVPNQLSFGHAVASVNAGLHKSEVFMDKILTLE